jgi:peptidyl-tRNA hydrolase
MKQAIIVKRDSGLTQGQLAAKIANASVKVLTNKINNFYYADSYGWNVSLNVDDAMKQWIENSLEKEVFWCESDSDFLSYENLAKQNKIPFSLVEEVCIAIGPDENGMVNNITKDLERM